MYIFADLALACEQELSTHGVFMREESDTAS